VDGSYYTNHLPYVSPLANSPYPYPYRGQKNTFTYSHLQPLSSGGGGGGGGGSGSCTSDERMKTGGVKSCWPTLLTACSIRG
jgi:hypothetical protein